VAVPALQNGITFAIERGQARHQRRVVGAVGIALILGISLTACTIDQKGPAATSSASSTASPEASASSDARLVPNGSASDNLAYFNLLAGAVTPANSGADGRAYIDALLAGGFDRNAMQVTFDRTQADLVADSILFSVNVADECLIGQNGPASDGFHSVVAPLLSTGLCLVGTTRPIDW